MHENCPRSILNASFPVSTPKRSVSVRHTLFSLLQALPVIKGLLDKLQGNMKELEAEESSDGIRQHYENTLAHVTHAMANDSTLYSDVEV